jgi:hypothetical protein
MCKEMPVIPVDRVVDKKRIIEKMEGRGGGQAQRVSDPQKTNVLMERGKFSKRVAQILQK